MIKLSHFFLSASHGSLKRCKKNRTNLKLNVPIAKLTAEAEAYARRRNSGDPAHFTPATLAAPEESITVVADSPASYNNFLLTFMSTAALNVLHNLLQLLELRIVWIHAPESFKGDA